MSLYYYELHEGPTDLMTDALLVSERDHTPAQFAEMVQAARRAIVDTYEDDTIVEAVARELERSHGFTYISDEKLRASMSVGADGGGHLPRRDRPRVPQPGCRARALVAGVEDVVDCPCEERGIVASRALTLTQEIDRAKDQSHGHDETDQQPRNRELAYFGELASCNGQRDEAKNDADEPEQQHQRLERSSIWDVNQAGEDGALPNLLDRAGELHVPTLLPCHPVRVIDLKANAIRGNVAGQVTP